MARRKGQIKAYIQGRKLWATRPVVSLGEGMFAYRGNLFSIDDFPANATVNLDKTEVSSVGEYNPKEPPKKKKRKRGYRTKYLAYFYSNSEECPDVKSIYST